MKINSEYEKYVQKSKELTSKISNNLNLLQFKIDLLQRKRMEQPYFFLNSNIYNYYTGINNIYPKSDFQNENYFESNDFSQIPHPEKIIRTIKNKKVVYCQGDFNSINQFPQNLILNEIKPIQNINENEIENNEKEIENRNRGQRGSKYRGVSKNGNQWQVLIMINKKKRYIGNYKNEEEAASSYDIVAIQNHGNKAKTNFYYTPEEIQRIRKMKDNFNLNN